MLSRCAAARRTGKTLRRAKANGAFALAAASFAPLNLLLANLASSDQRIHARLRQPLPCAVHAKAQGFGFNPILATMPLVIVGASLLHCFAIGMLGKSHPGRKSETKDGEEETAVHHYSSAISVEARVRLL